MEPLQREMKCKWEQKNVKTVLVDGDPSRPRMGPKQQSVCLPALTSSRYTCLCVLESYIVMPRCVCVANHSLNSILS